MSKTPYGELQVRHSGWWVFVVDPMPANSAKASKRCYAVFDAKADFMNQWDLSAQVQY